MATTPSPIDAPGVVPFHRPARVFPEVPPSEPIVVAAPPTVPSGVRGAWLQLLIPILGSLGMIGFALIWSNVIFLAVAGGLAVLTAAVYISLRLQQSRHAKRERRRNEVRYREHLAETERRLAGVAEAQRARLERVHPDPSRVWAWATSRRNLWERRPEDPDFLELRVGLGAVPLAAAVRLDVGSNPLTEYEPELLEAARSLVDRYERLELAPVTIPAATLGSLAVVGRPRDARPLARALLCELSAFHSPEDLRLLAYLPAEAEADWGWLKWLPHARASWLAGEEEAGRAVALAVEAQDLEVLLSQVVQPRIAHLDRVREAGPLAREIRFQQAVVLVDGFRPGTSLDPALEELFERGTDLGVLVVALCERPEDVPSRIGAVLTLEDGGWLSYEEATPDGRRERGLRADAAEVELCEGIARAMAPLRMRTQRGRATRVESEGLLDLLGMAESMDVAAAWAADRPDRSLLRAPLGIGEDGSPMVLDLKEAAEDGMGPHGLVVGATGSGKSELLRTLVTGLAATHPPEDLAFVLVDYKGGATFAELDGLPHIAGMITNLEQEPTLIDRMHEALFGELERRQRMLHEAGNVDRVRDYALLRARDPSLPPLPNLLVVVDEFGELLTNRPDFLDLFVSIGRVGRSLGIHLLLATQRLDEGRIRGLEGHLRYRICLRTFSADESLVALGTRDAFELPPLPGLGYLKVDAGMQRFKAALASGPHRERRPETPAPDVVRAFEPTGPGRELAVIGEDPADAPPSQMPAAPTDAAPRPVRTDMQVLTTSIRDAAGTDRRVRQVWLPPLPSAVTLDAVVDNETDASPGSPGWLRVPVGLLDRPRTQSQIRFDLDFGGTGGHVAVVGAPRTGKSTALLSLIGGLAVSHDPRHVQVYAIDLGGGRLDALADVPHVGAVYSRGDHEGIERLIREMEAIIDGRAAAFRADRIDGMDSFHRARREGRIDAAHGEVFLLVDNWPLLVQDMPHLEDRLGELVTTGLHYGLHVVLTANRWNDVRLAVRDNVGGRLELRLNDPIESEIDRLAAAAVPDGTPGRALNRAGEHVHLALPRVDGRADVGGLAVGIEGLVDAARSRWAASPAAPPIRMLPREVPPELLPDPVSDPVPGVAIGIEEFGLEPVRLDLFDADAHFLVFGEAESGKTTALRAWMSRLAAAHPAERVRIAVVDYRRTLFGAVPETHLAGYAVTPEAAAELASRLAAELGARLPSPDLSPEDLGRRRWWTGPEIVLVIDDYDLVAGPSGNPVGGLVDLLAQGRDIGFHVVLARRVSGTARSAFEPFLQRIRELGTPGLILSGDPQEGPLIDDQKAQPLPPGRGFLIRRRRASLVHVATVSAPAQAPERATESR